MIPLKRTIIAPLQMLERLAGGKNPLNSLVYGCDDLGDPDCFLDYKNDLISTDCGELSVDCHDNSFQLPNEPFQRSDLATQDTARDMSFRNQNHELEVCDQDKDYGASECRFSTSSTAATDRRHKCTYDSSTERDIFGYEDQSSSKVSWYKECGTQLTECKDVCSECARYTQHLVDKRTPLHPSADVNLPCSECCFCVSCNIEDFKQGVSGNNDFQELKEKTIRRRQNREMLGNLPQLNSTDENMLSIPDAEAEFKSKVSSEEDTSYCNTTHDLHNPECSVCFRVHALRDDDVSFSCYAVLPDCQHSFCQRCIASWLQQSAIDRWRCPVCRTPVLFTFASRRWLPHNSDEKTRQLSGTRCRLLLTRTVLRKATALLRFLLFYWTVGVKALRNLIEEITPEFEPLLHRHEIGSFI